MGPAGSPAPRATVSMICFRSIAEAIAWRTFGLSSGFRFVLRKRRW